MELKPIAPFGMEVKNKLFLLRGHAAVLEAGMQVVDPAEAAALPGAIEA